MGLAGSYACRRTLRLSSDLPHLTMNAEGYQVSKSDIRTILWHILALPGPGVQERIQGSRARRVRPEIQDCET
jgi:hypothetical protein